MSFRKRNIALSQSGLSNSPLPVKAAPLPGIRPSPVSGSQITSTGTASLDKLLGLGGFALGSSLLIEEEGTTDFSSSLLRCFAAEGVLQGHAVFVVAPEGSMVLPEIVEELGSGSSQTKDDAERMKIAWRYESLGAFKGREGRGLPQRQPAVSLTTSDNLEVRSLQVEPFCHTFDLTKRLQHHPSSIPVAYISPSQTASEISPFQPILAKLTSHLTTNPAMVTRLVLPSLLSPLFYPPSASQPHHLLSFVHSLRGLLRTSQALNIMISWPLALYPRHLSLTRCTETILDGVILLQPFPHAYSIDSEHVSHSSGSCKDDEKMQGLLRVLKAPVLSERGVGVGGLGASGSGEDMAFAVGRKRFVVRPFHLPPMEEEEKGSDAAESKSTADLEF